MKKHKRKLKKLPVLIISLLIIILIICFIFFNKKDSLIKVEYDNNIEIDINKEVYNTDYIHKISNGTLKTSKQQIDTSKLGHQIIEFIIIDDNNKEHTYSYEINIVDKEKPIINYTKSLETKEGTKIDLLKDVTVTDNSKEEIIPTIEGEYNINVPGTYTLTYIAKDSSNNETKEEFTLKVNPISSNPSNPDKTFTTSKGFKGVIKNGITYIDGYLVVNKTYSLPKDYAPGLDKTTKEAFDKMNAAAKLEGLNIWLQSGFRSYDTQKRIYNSYVSQDGQKNADTYSARPGHSEHQSGLAFDVNQINDSFIGTPEAIWLENNCYKYGFILRYPKGKENITGYQYESWHFRYVGKELATKLYNNGNWITMEEYFGITSEYQ